MSVGATGFAPDGYIYLANLSFAMLGREERIALLLLIVVALSLCTGYGIITYLGNSVFAATFSSSSPEGQLVVFNGSVDRVTATINGGNLILECDGVTVFLPSQVAQTVAIEKGSRIQLYGIVQTYRGKKEIVVSSAGDIAILR